MRSQLLSLIDDSRQDFFLKNCFMISWFLLFTEHLLMPATLSENSGLRDGEGAGVVPTVEVCVMQRSSERKGWSQGRR